MPGPWVPSIQVGTPISAYRQLAGLALERGDALTSPLFAGLTVSLAEVFE